MITVPRPSKAPKPVGLLGYEQFQTAYVTNDLARAKKALGDIYGIRNWSDVDGGVMRIALAWSNGLQFELIETASDQHQPLYDDWIQRDGDFVIRHHHLGYFVNSNDEWQLLRRQIEAVGREIWMDIDTGVMKVIYIEAPELGHFLEYIFPNEEGRKFFSGCASN